MTKPDWQRVRALFEAASDLPGSERAAFVERECANDPDLRAEVERLLAADVDSSTWFEPPHTAPSNEDPAYAPPERVGDFQILDELGRGGMGVVYRARQVPLDREVALKVLHRTLSTPMAVVDRFHREARTIAQVRHPNIVEVYVDGRSGTLDWFAMELVGGGDLKEEIEVQRTEAKRDTSLLPRPGEASHVRHCAELCRDVARALHFAHQRGVVHRDVKPGNLLLTKTGVVKVADFGIARHEALGSLTKDGEIAGSVAYMSPEQARLTGAQLDHRTDVYSLGVVLYELTTLVQPFAAPTEHDTRSRILRGRPKAPRLLNREVPRDLEVVCLKAIEQDPRDRYHDAAALADDLQRFLDHRSVVARPMSVYRRSTSFLRRHVRSLVALLGIAIALVCGRWYAIESAAEQSLSQMLEVIRAEVPRVAGAWEQLPLLDLRQLVDACRQVQNGSRRISPEDSRLLGQAQLEVDRYRREITDRGRQMITEGQAVRPDPGISEGNAAKILTGWGLLQRAYFLFGDPAVLEGFGANPAAPALTIRATRPNGRELEGRASYSRLDLLTGEPGPTVELGALPVVVREVEEGYFRITVVLDEGRRIREFSRHLVAGYRGHEIDCVLRPEQDGVELVRISGGTMRLEDEDPFIPSLNEADVSVDGFLLGPNEVTVREWRAYVEARRSEGLSSPSHWMLERIQPGSPQDELPIVDIGWRQAREFAEWYGCRLPSFVEYSWAARGPTGRQVPWLWGEPRASVATPERGDWFGNVHGREANQSERADRNGFDLTQLRPVGSDPKAATPAPMSVNDLLGNAREWLESSCPNPDTRGGLTPRPTQRMAVGGHWTIAGRAELSAPYLQPRGIENVWRSSDTGFRVARSTFR